VAEDLPVPGDVGAEGRDDGVRDECLVARLSHHRLTEEVEGPSRRDGSRRIPNGSRRRLLKRFPRIREEAGKELGPGVPPPGHQDRGDLWDGRPGAQGSDGTRRGEVEGLAPRPAGRARGPSSHEGVRENTSEVLVLGGRRAEPCLPPAGTGMQSEVERQRNAGPAEEDEQSSVLDEDDSSAHTYVPSSGGRQPHGRPGRHGIRQDIP